MLGSHGLHGIDLPYEESSRIPLLIRYPRRATAEIENDALVSNVDYAPTLLSLCGVQPLAEMQGRNLAGVLTGGEGAPATGSRATVGAFPPELRLVGYEAPCTGDTLSPK